MVEREPHAPRKAPPVDAGEVYSVANMITMLRLLITPVFFTLLVIRDGRYSVLAFALFVLASATDFLDGMIARRTGTVTALGKMIDPLVDRLLLAFGVLGLYVLDRLALWVAVLLVARDLYLLYGAWVLERHGRRMPVLFIGKVTTAVLLTAFSALMLGDAVSFGRVTPLAIGTTVMYVGVGLSMVTAVVYTIGARRMLAEAKAEER